MSYKYMHRSIWIVEQQSQCQKPNNFKEYFTEIKQILNISFWFFNSVM